MNNEKVPTNNSEQENSINEIPEKFSDNRQEEGYEKPKSTVENHSERAIDEAREKIQEAVREKYEKHQLDHKEAAPVEQPERRVGRTKREKEQAFATTIDEARRHMSPVGRSFSRFIHHPVVEKTSDVVGSTIARPNAIAMGAIFAFLFTLAIYLIAHNNGYPLSGTESIAAFIAGWLFGQLFDYFKTLITGKR